MSEAEALLISMAIEGPVAWRDRRLRRLAEPRAAARRLSVDGRHRRHPSADVGAGDLVLRPLSLLAGDP